MGTFPFLQLPRELRDQIYSDYFSSPNDTYIFDFPSKKLRKSDNSPIHVALIATCQAIAEETRGLPFCINTITFNTIYADDLRAQAYHFDAILHLRTYDVSSLFVRHAPFMDHTKMQDVTSRYPRLITAIEDYNKYLTDSDHDWKALRKWEGLHYREYRASLAALRNYIGSLSADANYPYPSKPDRPRERKAVEEFLAVDINPWDIPTEKDLLGDFLELASGISIAKLSGERSEVYEAEKTKICHPDSGKYRYSAAAAAIYFLRSTTPDARARMRNIQICEDLPSVADPSSHALGLIPFCQENPALRIVRRASLWRNIFYEIEPEEPWQRRIRYIHHHATHSLGWTPVAGDLPVMDFGMPVARWMAEAGDLESMGMPAGQYTLDLDGDPFPELTTKVFRNGIHLAALRQETMAKAPLGPGDRSRWHPESHKSQDWFLCEGFPEVLRDLSSNPRSGLITCSFDPGSPLGTPEEILATHPEWHHQEWEYELHDWPGANKEWPGLQHDSDELVLLGWGEGFMEDNMLESYRKKWPNGPPDGPGGPEAPDWVEPTELLDGSEYQPNDAGGA
ncbi:unnamed protein product [Clonostachys byssicola]|uniref:Uncharacterized protein n=1 Tax=Clonostachys byssicola TaxID=160290 RepID=A0A9N9UG07_9HYPO|nr:unnamed protein product [Clonostachys byssicola]